MWAYIFLSATFFVAGMMLGIGVAAATAAAHHADDCMRCWSTSMRGVSRPRDEYQEDDL